MESIGNAHPNHLFSTLLYWIVERQKIFWNRVNGAWWRLGGTYTDDPVLQRYKFTNVYRVLDRASQYLLRCVIYNGKTYTREDMFWRILIFKHFNLPSTWEYLIGTFGDITAATSLDEIAQTLTHRLKQHKPIYSNAYMLTASFMGNESALNRLGIPHTPFKHKAYLDIFERHLRDNGLYLDVLNAQTFTRAFELLKQVPTMGDFLSYQYIQDLNYSPYVSWDNNEFCAAGFGTQRGIKRVFDIEGKPDYAAIVQWTHANLETLLRTHQMYDAFKPLPGHWPTVPDISNCFCEVDKYLRGKGVVSTGIKRSRVKNKFNPTPSPINYMFPPKWGVKSL